MISTKFGIVTQFFLLDRSDRDDESESMDRAALMDTVVKGMLAKKETKNGAVARRVCALYTIAGSGS